MFKLTKKEVEAIQDTLDYVAAMLLSREGKLAVLPGVEGMKQYEMISHLANVMHDVAHEDPYCEDEPVTITVVK